MKRCQEIENYDMDELKFKIQESKDFTLFKSTCEYKKYFVFEPLTISEVWINPLTTFA